MAPDSAVMPQSRVSQGCGLFRTLMAHLPAAVRDSFTETQVHALGEAAERCRWGEHPTDIRLSIPLLTKRYYLVLLAGEERRCAERRRVEGQKKPVATAANLLFLGGAVVLATLLGSLIWTLGFVWFLSL